MFGTTKVKLDSDLVAKIKRYAEIAGYSSPEEFITHALEKELLVARGIHHPRSGERTREAGRRRLGRRDQEAPPGARLHLVAFHALSDSSSQE